MESLAEELLLDFDELELDLLFFLPFLFFLPPRRFFFFLFFFLSFLPPSDPVAGAAGAAVEEAASPWLNLHLSPYLHEPVACHEWHGALLLWGEGARGVKYF